MEGPAIAYAAPGGGVARAVGRAGDCSEPSGQACFAFSCASPCLAHSPQTLPALLSIPYIHLLLTTLFKYHTRYRRLRFPALCLPYCTSTLPLPYLYPTLPYPTLLYPALPKPTVSRSTELFFIRELSSPVLMRTVPVNTPTANTQVFETVCPIGFRSVSGLVSDSVA